MINVDYLHGWTRNCEINSLSLINPSLKIVDCIHNWDRWILESEVME
jgi:hypothetical protein